MDKTVKVVKYNGGYYVWYMTNQAGFAKLIAADGSKFSGTPKPDKLEVVKTIPTKEYNGSEYFSTKIGIFSARTGNRIVLEDILKLF